MDLACLPRWVPGAAAAALLLTGCAQSVNGTPIAAAPGLQPPTVAAHGFPTTPAAVAALLHRQHPAHSRRLTTLQVGGGHQTRTVVTERLRHGVVTAMRRTITTDGTAGRLIVIGADVWVQPSPTSAIPHTRPWIKLTAATADPSMHQLYEQALALRATNQAPRAETFAHAAHDLRLVGVSGRGKNSIAHYRLELDVSALQVDPAELQALKQQGVTSIPTQLWMDRDGRARRLSNSITVSGTTVRTEFRLTRLNERVHIVPPPKSQTERT